MKRNFCLWLLFSLGLAAFAQADLEEYFNLCLEFGAPMGVVQLYQPFRTYKAEINNTISYVAKEDESLLEDKPYSEYQIWYTIDKDQGLYQSSLIIRGERAVLQQILTSYLKKFNESYGEPVYTHLNNGSLLVFWYSEDTFIVRARLILDIENPYKFVSITYCSPMARHARLLRTLYNGSDDEDETIPAPVTSQETTPIIIPGMDDEDSSESIEETSSEETSSEETSAEISTESSEDSASGQDEEIVEETSEAETEEVTETEETVEE